MQTDEVVKCQSALEALRSGVPNHEAVRVLGSNQREVEDLFAAALESTRGAEAAGQRISGVLISGGFGAGKSHLLEYLEHVALSEGFVCSRVAISKETPLYDPVKMFQAAMDNAVLPDANGQLIQEVGSRLDASTEQYAELNAWANSPGSGLNALFPATLLLHETIAGSDPELVDQITGFWSGERLAIGRIRQGLKQVNSAARYQLKTPKVKELARQRFLFTSRLIRAAGYRGWVLLIDEVELIGRYSLLQRGRSYAELALWLGKIRGEGVPGVVAVAAITDDFALAVLKEKGDREIVGQRFRSKGGDEFTILAGRAEAGMRLVERSAIALRPPDEGVLRETYQRLKRIHAEAYAWDPPEIAQQERSVARRMRSYVRRWVNEWDLLRLYPGVDITPEEERTLRFTYEEDADLTPPDRSETEE
ncbi:MAG: DUF2791 family P-loop domain-containing protein [Bryobacterales bacterium]|nr:DUF2791 family P-loop domain-containing protein [Bryobacterales bacterium]